MAEDHPWNLLLRELPGADFACERPLTIFTGDRRMGLARQLVDGLRDTLGILGGYSNLFAQVLFQSQKVENRWGDYHL